jgi:hypothetical protein
MSKFLGNKISNNIFYIFLYLSGLLVGLGALGGLNDVLFSQDEYEFSDLIWVASLAFCSLYGLFNSHIFFYKESNQNIKVLLPVYLITLGLMIYFCQFL